VFGYTRSQAAVARTAESGDAAIRHALQIELPKVEEAGSRADGGHGSPGEIQAQYDTARDFDEMLDAAGPVTVGCEGLLAAAHSLAGAEIMQAEGVDRPSHALTTRGIRLAASYATKLAQMPRRCSSGPIVARAVETSELTTPKSGEAFTGLANAVAPEGTTSVDVLAGRSLIGRAVLNGRVASFTLEGTYENKDLHFRFKDRSRPIGELVSRNTWLLPGVSKQHRAAKRVDRTLNAKLALAASGFSGQAGIWVQNLATGTYAGWNEDAVFPAASTVKLGVLVAALQRFGARPERSPVAYDLRALTGWSSNLAANRLVRILGHGSITAGTMIAQSTLKRLGATASSYTGVYVIGTMLVPIGGKYPPAISGRSVERSPNVTDPPPLVSSRVTTARDLGRILYELHAAAMGDRSALRVTRLTVHEARLAIALLLASQPRGDNIGLFRPSVGPNAPMAQKNGWLRDARHTAAIMYTEEGPVIVVLLTYRTGLTRSEAADFASKVLKAVLPSDAFGA
jgi:hypothetical protein